jgi:hypothetical protein
MILTTVESGAVSPVGNRPFKKKGCNMKTQTQVPLTDKKYFLTKEETANIESRQQLIKQYQYIIHVINADIQAYNQFVILKRLAIPEGKNYILSPDNTFITLPGGENEKKT